MRVRGRRPVMRRAVYYLPNGFTLFNLFCGMHAIVLSSRGSFSKAALYIFLGGIADVLDGRVARATNSGSRMGEELDSLVDGISFGLAPAMMMYFAVLNHENWEWLFGFLFTACAVMRLARFNVEQAGRAKSHFHGLPSPAAGLTLSTYYWFSQTPLYNQAVILFTDNKTLVELPWHAIIPGLMGLLSFLMVSNVPYPAVPTLGWRSFKQLLTSVVVVVALFMAIFYRSQFLFPALLAYVLFGGIKFLAFGLIGRRANPDEIYFQLDPEEELAAVAAPPPRRTPVRGSVTIPAPVSTGDEVVAPPRKRRRRRRPQGERGDRPDRGDRQERVDRNDRGGRGRQERGPRGGRPESAATGDSSPTRERSSAPRPAPESPPPSSPPGSGGGDSTP